MLPRIVRCVLGLGAALGLGLGVGAACGSAKDPRFKAACAPDAALEKVVCTVENVGKARGRACLTATQDLPQGRPLIAQRACTGVIEPGGTATLVPRFDGDLAKCVTLQPHEWICKGHILESERALGENIPPEATPSPPGSAPKPARPKSPERKPVAPQAAPARSPIP
ncbi:MAG: hypothetical protein H0X17_05125 [Deltaproteobacteria bacterium]|nr:hypothetical protein [Deltaproteobacteria bacterium]